MLEWSKITLVGVGLLGGSLGLAIKQRRLAGRVDGYVRRPASVVECLQRGVVDQATLDLPAAVQDADLVILCTPLAQMGPLAAQMLSSLKPGTIVTDVGSVKAPVIQALEAAVEGVGAHFVGSHPMAGAEKMGVVAARADLFINAVCVLTPTARSSKPAVQRLEQFWKQVGARPIQLKPEVHDELVGRSSHLPHVVAAELANCVLDPARPKEQVMLCASGFRDTTRIASGSPEMWRDIALANRKHLSHLLGAFIDDLREFQVALDNGNTQAIEEFFVKAKQRRDDWCANGASLSPE